MPEPLDQTNLEAPYTRILFNGIASIYEKWVNRDIEDALEEALILVVNLPTDIKDAMWDKKLLIEKDLNRAYRVQGSDFFLTHLRRNRTAQKVARIYLSPFMDEMTRRLDEKGWLHRGALRARFRKDKTLDADV